MSRPLLGCIADDNTGATDVAGMLSRAGLNVIQCFGIPSRFRAPARWQKRCQSAGDHPFGRHDAQILE